MQGLSQIDLPALASEQVIGDGQADARSKAKMVIATSGEVCKRSLLMSNQTSQKGDNLVYHIGRATRS